MTIYTRTDFEAALRQGSGDFTSRLFFFFGDRYLSKKAADLLQEALLRDQPGVVQPVDGDTEDPGQTLSRLMSFSLLPGRQLYRVTDTRLFHSQKVAGDLWSKAFQAYNAGKQGLAARQLSSLLQAAQVSRKEAANLQELDAGEWQRLFGFDKPDNVAWAEQLLSGPDAGSSQPADQSDRYLAAFDKGLPANNYLLLTAETVDKRHRLFTWLKKNATVVDCSVAEGASQAAQTAQKEVLAEVMQATLREFGKGISPKAVEMFFERVGFSPQAVAVETEKLAHYVGDRQTISAEDIDEMVARSKEDALYELTDAFVRRQLGRSLTLLNRLQDQAVHGLAIIATMRNFIRRLLIIKSLQQQSPPSWRKGMNPREFQSSYLPALKEQGAWPELFKAHPYALFKSFEQAADLSVPMLKSCLALLLAADFKLKGSGLPDRVVLDELFLSLHKGPPRLS